MIANLANTTAATIEHPHSRLIELISPQLQALGYRILDLEIQSHRQKTLRIYIDHLETYSGTDKIGIEDCAKVSRALDEPLEQDTEIGSFLNGAYDLEISSPGINRPLRTIGDFQKYAGSKVRIHVYRPLTADELDNAPYQTANPKQKNFLGQLLGLRNGKVALFFPLESKESGNGKRKSKGEKSKKDHSPPTNSEEEKIVTIPLPLISKANLEPEIDFEGSNERELEI